MNTTTGKQTTPSTRANIGSDRTYRIGSAIGDTKASIGAGQEQTSVSPNNQISADRTSGIGSIISSRQSFIRSAAKPPSLSSNAGVGSSDSAQKSSAPTVDKQRDRSRINIIESNKDLSVGRLVTDRNLPVANIRGNSPKLSAGETTSPDNSSAASIGSKSAEHGPRINAGRQSTHPGEEVDDNHRSASRTLRPSRSGPDRLGGLERHNVNSFQGIGRQQYIDRGYAVRQVHRHEHVYMDCHDRIWHRIVWPRYHYPVYYGYGPRFTFGYVYPYYLRRYVFVSLGGYWPVEYTCVRYYWYGCHPYYWCGYYPIAREVQGNTYNYYTYNYYYDDDGSVVSEPAQAMADGIQPVDHNTFADVREKLAQQAAKEPDQQTPADTYFDEAVAAFEACNYKLAIEKFAKARELAPDDMVLPFAYCQALFANELYSEAAKVLRDALAKVCPEKEGVFYARGLYLDNEVLIEQIDRLTEITGLYSFDADLQLLLGYQLLGIGEIDKAAETLQQASRDLENAAAAKTLLALLEKIKTNNTCAESIVQ